MRVFVEGAFNCHGQQIQTREKCREVALWKLHGKMNESFSQTSQANQTKTVTLERKQVKIQDHL